MEKTTYKDISNICLHFDLMIE